MSDDKCRGAARPGFSFADRSYGPPVCPYTSEQGITRAARQPPGSQAAVLTYV
jgi:hypothetical protein